jgi:hypothetical protein
MTAILELITGNLLPYIIAAGAAVLAIIGAYFKGGANARAKRAVKDAKADQQSHERMNNAETGSGMSDDQRIDRLREFAAKHGNRPPKAGGR